MRDQIDNPDGSGPAPTERDRLFAEAQPHLVDFQFNQDVVSVFPDMIRRSVPGYETVLPLTGLMAAEHLPERGVLYDLGCSQGASTAAVLACLGQRAARLIGVDSSAPMLDSARARILDARVSWQLADITTLTFEPCDVVLLNYVQQFLAPEQRLTLLQALREVLGSDGCILLSEKIRLEPASKDQWFNDLHLQFKRANGYSDMEIAGKRNALENVMIIDSEAVHRERLQRAGFTRVHKWFQCLNWASFIIQP